MKNFTKYNIDCFWNFYTMGNKNILLVVHVQLLK